MGLKKGCQSRPDSKVWNNLPQYNGNVRVYCSLCFYKTPVSSSGFIGENQTKMQVFVMGVLDFYGFSCRLGANVLYWFSMYGAPPPPFVTIKRKSILTLNIHEPDRTSTKAMGVIIEFSSPQVKLIYCFSQCISLFYLFVRLLVVDVDKEINGTLLFVIFLLQIVLLSTPHIVIFSVI